jgi:hypothetical protein
MHRSPSDEISEVTSESGGKIPSLVGTPRKLNFSIKQVMSPVMVKTEKDTDTSSVNVVSYLDKAYIVPIRGTTPCNGLCVYFLESEHKQNKSGPFSAKHMHDLVMKEHDFGGLVFEKRSFPLLRNGEVEYFPGKGDRKYAARAFFLMGIMEPLSDEQYKEILHLVVSEIIDTHEIRYSSQLVEIDENTCVVDSCKVWTDITLEQDAFQNLTYKYPAILKNGLQKKWIGDDEGSWGKSNMDVVQVYFKKGQLSAKVCKALGLPKIWALEDQRDD